MESLFNRALLRSFVLLALLALLAACDSEGRRAAYFEKGKTLFEAGDLARARLELKNVLQIDEKFAPGWYWMGRVEESEGDLRKAFGDYTRAIELDPGFVEPMVRRGQILVLAGDLEAAQKDSDKAVSLAPKDADALTLRAGLRARDNDLDGALADAKAALADQPGHAGASAMAATILHKQGDAEGAIEVLLAGISANPGVASLRLVLARFYHESGNTEGALEALSALAAEDPDNKGHRDRLVAYLLQQGRGSEAEAILRSAIEGAPGDAANQRVFIAHVNKTRGVDAALAEVAVLQKAEPESLSLRFMEAELLRSSGKSEQAEQVLRQIIQDPGVSGADLVRARNGLAAMLVLDREEEAAELVAAVLAESPTEPTALQLRAAMALRAGQADQAVGDLRTVLRDYPDRVNAQRMIGKAHALMGEEALAQEAFEQAIILAPADPIAYLQLAELRVRYGDNAGALLVLERLLDRVPDNQAVQHAIAKIQMSNQDWKALAETAERIQKARPQHPLGYYLHGLVLQRQGDHQAAIVSFEQALAADPDAIEPLVGLARSHLAMGAPEKAQERIVKVLESNPNNLVALNLLGDIAAANDEPAKAVERFDEAIRFHPRSPRAYGRLAQLQTQAGDLDAARQTLERGARETERNADLVFRLAALLEKMGEYGEAITAYEDVLERYPNADVAANNVALLIADHQGGAEGLDRALLLAERFRDSEVPEFLDTLGWVHYRRGEFDKALPYLQKAVASRPQSAEMQYHLGMAHRQLGDPDTARQHLLIAVSSEAQSYAVEKAQLALDELGGVK